MPVAFEIAALLELRAETPVDHFQTLADSSVPNESCRQLSSSGGIQWWLSLLGSAV